MNLRSLSPKQIKELRKSAKRMYPDNQDSIFKEIKTELDRRQTEQVKLHKAI